MSEHTEYQQKVAEAIDAALPHGEEIIEIDTDGNVSKPRIAGIAAVLDAEGAVDPAGHQHTRDTLLKALKRCENYERNLAACDALIEQLKADYLKLANDNVTFYQGVEWAAKMVDEAADPAPTFYLARLIRAKIQREAGSRGSTALAEAERSGSASRIPTGDAP